MRQPQVVLVHCPYTPVPVRKNETTPDVPQKDGFLQAVCHSLPCIRPRQTDDDAMPLSIFERNKLMHPHAQTQTVGSLAGCRNLSPYTAPNHPPCLNENNPPEVHQQDMQGGLPKHHRGSIAERARRALIHGVQRVGPSLVPRPSYTATSTNQQENGEAPHQSRHTNLDASSRPTASQNGWQCCRSHQTSSKCLHKTPDDREKFRPSANPISKSSRHLQ